METKSLIIDIATTLFQQKGFIGVGINEILNACNLSRASFYHHFPKGKEKITKISYNHRSHTGNGLGGTITGCLTAQSVK
ncbi:TetR/AcrR family transcriptional regulator [Cytobacillus horneckiae]|uniref:TetR/AcrR family transcriptional regulator n=1 Tax=Cytobacillus horneckiae TaxID=549687 RepID=A0A2N0ZC10_9BACI|nr:TetR/AcrR family transcriptional regulator [Cytobacillus horneckiae]MEC1155993.1 TetR/AcrR family transcriptional regulator [Cytobacillus horneckiae]MED2939731.1 TetR/AcrR family transcriptional regulator [Cytobacillus horneckiae]PKG27046.1 TetR/AcrR family transcriptional regulator [Cytobacillus horneckiae]